jgi:hypothetical protein
VSREQAIRSEWVPGVCFPLSLLPLSGQLQEVRE